MNQYKVLLTGYKSSKVGNISTSLEVLEKINGDFEKFLFTNDFNIIDKEIDEIFKNNYEFIIMLGWKPLIKKILVEIEAKYNQEVLYTNFSLEYILNNLKKNNIDYAISENVGNSFCNYAYYKVLKYIKKKKLDTQAIFIHIPNLNNFVQMQQFVRMFNKFKK